MNEGDFRLDADGRVHVYSGGTWKPLATGSDFSFDPISPGEYVIPSGRVAVRPPPSMVPVDSLGTPVHTAISFVEMVVIELLDRDGVAEMVHAKLNGRINDWAEANGYTVTQVDVEADRGTATFHHVSVRATAHLVPREDGEWPSIRRAVHEDQTELTLLQTRTVATADLSSLGTRFASAADAMTTFSDRMDAFSAAFRPWTASLPAPPPAEPCSEPCCNPLLPADRDR